MRKIGEMEKSMRLNNKAFEEVAKMINSMATVENSAEAEKAVAILTELKNHSQWLKEAVRDLGDAIWDCDDRDTVLDRLNEISCYIVIDDDEDSNEFEKGKKIINDELNRLHHQG